MNQSLESTLVLCDLDNLLLGADGNLTQVVRDVLQLFSSRGGRFTVFSQRSPRAVRSILGSVRLAAPALVCGGAMAYHYADGTRQPLCSFAGQDADLFAQLPSAAGVGIALQMTDGTTRVLRMSNALERHLQQEWTPYLLANAADIKGENVLRVLLYQDSKAVPMVSLLGKALGDRTAVLLGERAAPDTLLLTPKTVSGKEMLDAVCGPACVEPENVLVLAGCSRCPGRAAPCRPERHPDRRICGCSGGSAVPYGAGCRKIRVKFVQDLCKFFRRGLSF